MYPYRCIPAARMYSFLVPPPPPIALPEVKVHAVCESSGVAVDETV